MYRKIRSGWLPLQQLVGRLSEVSKTTLNVTSKMEIRITTPNNVFFFRNKPMEVFELVNSDVFNCKRYKSVEPMFDVPTSSALIGAYLVGNQSQTEVVQLHRSKLTNKGFKIISENNIYFLSILNSG